MKKGRNNNKHRIEKWKEGKKKKEKNEEERKRWP